MAFGGSPMNVIPQELQLSFSEDGHNNEKNPITEFNALKGSGSSLQGWEDKTDEIKITSSARFGNKPKKNYIGKDRRAYTKH